MNVSAKQIAALIVLALAAGGIFVMGIEKIQPASPTVQELRAMIPKLVPLHTPLGKPKPGEWLDCHKEPGQTFEQYLKCKPVLPQGKRTTIYIQPLGPFDETQRKIITLTADFMGRYFNLPVKIQEDLSLEAIPQTARRVHPTWGDKQILTTYILDKVLAPSLPKDAAARIAFTAVDLWPGKNWNFVFGQASLEDRVGVWSLYRNGDPATEFQLCLLRTIKTATHETGHMFSLRHCTAYACNMCGANNRAEADGRPVALCPQCLAKICWACKVQPVKRFQSLAEFFTEKGFKVEAEFCAASIRTLQK